MIDISIVQEPEEKTAITLRIMHSLPEWFSPPEDIDEKAIIHKAYPFIAAYDGTEPIGFITLKIHNQYTKVDIGNVWQSMAGADYRYHMVFRNKDLRVNGAVRFDRFMEIVRGL